MDNGIITTGGDGRRIVLSDKKNTERASDLTRSEIAIEVATAIDSMRSVDGIVSTLHEMDVIDQHDAHVLLDSYGAIRDAAVDMNEYLNHMKKTITDWLEGHPDVPEIEDRITLTRFFLSKPSEDVSYDTDGLKRDRPDVWKRVSKRFGKRLKKSERAEIEEQVQELKRQLASLNSRLAEDDAAHSDHFDSCLFDNLIPSDESLAQYRHSTQRPRRFYYKESSDSDQFTDQK